VPSVNPAANYGIWLLASVTTTYTSTSTYALSARIGSSGQLIVDLIDPTGANYRRLSLTGFRAAYAGQWVMLHVTWDGSAAPIVYVNGVAQAMAETTGGTAPAWSTAVDSSFFTLGVFAAADLFNGRMALLGPINGVLTAGEVLTHVQTGKLPRWCDIGIGSMAASYTPNWSSTADSWSAARSTVSGGNSGVTDGSTSKDNCLKFYADNTATNSHYTYRAATTGLVGGQKYRVAGYYYVPSAQTHVDGIQIINNTLSADSYKVVTQLSVTGTWTAFSSEFVAVAYSGQVIDFYATAASSASFTGAGSSSDDRFYLQGVTFTPIGPLYRPIVQPILVVADSGSNALDGMLIAGVAPVTRKKDWVIQWNTTTSGNQQLCAASVFIDYTKILLDDWCVNNAGTSKTISLGSASAGTQYLNGGTAAAGRNKVTLVTPLAASAALWCNSNGTDALQHTVRGHVVD